MPGPLTFSRTGPGDPRRGPGGARRRRRAATVLSVVLAGGLALLVSAAAQATELSGPSVRGTAAQPLQEAGPSTPALASQPPQSATDTATVHEPYCRTYAALYPASERAPGVKVRLRANACSDGREVQVANLRMDVVRTEMLAQVGWTIRESNLGSRPSAKQAVEVIGWADLDLSVLGQEVAADDIEPHMIIEPDGSCRGWYGTLENPVECTKEFLSPRDFPGLR